MFSCLDTIQASVGQTDSQADNSIAYCGLLHGAITKKQTHGNKINM